MTQFRLDEAPALQRDPRLRKEVIRVLLQFSDVISIGGYGKTNLISHHIEVHPGTTLIKMKHRPLNPIMEESLRQQIDRWLEQRAVEEADSPWSFPLVPVPKKNSKEVRWAVDYRKLNAVTKKDAFPLPNIADNLPASRAAKFSLPLTGLELSTQFLCGALTGRRQLSPPHSDSTSLSGCPLVWLMLLLPTPGWWLEPCAIYHPRRSSVTWMIPRFIPMTLGAICEFSAKSWPPSVPLASRSLRGKPSYSATISST